MFQTFLIITNPNIGYTLYNHQLIRLGKVFLKFFKIRSESKIEPLFIRELKEAVPDLAGSLIELESKLVDLLPVVRNNVYAPAFKGSFSLKAVLNPLVPDLTYDDLVIVDGRLASVEIARMLFVSHKIPVEERDRVRQDLLDYCERDTWATVKLLERLRDLAGT